MAEDLKRDIRDEVEFRQAQLNAQAQRLRGTVHMYLRDARMFVEQRDEPVARQMLIQKAMMEQRIAVMATHWSVLESVRVSLGPSERRCMGDLVTCRTILNKTGLEFIEPVVRCEGDHEDRHIDRHAIDTELRDLQNELFPRGAVEAGRPGDSAEGAPGHSGDAWAGGGAPGGAQPSPAGSAEKWVEASSWGEANSGRDSAAGSSGEGYLPGGDGESSAEGLADLLGREGGAEAEGSEGGSGAAGSAALLATIEQAGAGAGAPPLQLHVCANSSEADEPGGEAAQRLVRAALGAPSEAAQDAAWADGVQHAAVDAHEHKNE